MLVSKEEKTAPISHSASPVGHRVHQKSKIKVKVKSKLLPDELSKVVKLGIFLFIKNCTDSCYIGDEENWD